MPIKSALQQMSNPGLTRALLEAAFLPAAAGTAGAAIGGLMGYRKPKDSANKLEGGVRGKAIGRATGMGAGVGGVAGGVIGAQMGGNNTTKLLAAILGAGAGGLAGNQLSKAVLGEPGTQRA
jgi:hypothetical protein